MFIPVSQHYCHKPPSTAHINTLFNFLVSSFMGLWDSAKLLTSTILYPHCGGACDHTTGRANAERAVGKMGPFKKSSSFPSSKQDSLPLKPCPGLALTYPRESMSSSELQGCCPGKRKKHRTTKKVVPELSGSC